MAKYNVIHFVSIVLMVMCKLVFTDDNSFLITQSDPSGPVFPASTWIRFACKIDNHSEPDTLHYEWLGFCNTSNTAKLVVNEPIIDEDGWAVFWVLSTYTANECVDYVECHVSNGEGEEFSARRSIVVTGVGAHFDQTFLGSVLNNTAVLINEHSMTSLICQSAQRTSCVGGMWIDPQGIPIDVTNLRTSQSCVNSNSTWHTHAILNIQASEIGTNYSGLYTCIIPDENNTLRKVHIGLYSDLPSEVEKFIPSLYLSHFMEGSKVHIRCTTSHLPVASTVWSIDGQRTFSSSEYIAKTTLINVTQSVYASQLAFDWNGNREHFLQCDVYAEWVSPGVSYYESASVSGTFVMLTLDKPASAYCVTPEGVHQVKWLGDGDLNNDTSQLPGLRIVERRLYINNVSEIYHNLTFRCVGFNIDDNMQYVHLYKFIVSVPPEAISLALTGGQSQGVLEGEQFNTTCCYSIHSAGLLSKPILEWYRGSNKINSDSNMEYNIVSNNQCSTLNVISVRKPYDEERFTCTAVLPSFLLENGSFSAYVWLNISEADSTSSVTAANDCPRSSLLLVWMSLCIACAVVHNMCASTGLHSSIL